MVLRCGACGHGVTVAPWEAGFFRPIILLGAMPLGWVRVLGRRFGWEAGSLAGLALLPLLIMGGLSVLAWWLVKAAVYLGSGPRKCPACGARRWTWPQTGPVSLP